MAGDGPFMWIMRDSPVRGYRGVPEGGLCLSAFLVLVRGERILLGKYADHAAWDALAGLDASDRREWAEGWVIPATQLKFGEDPGDAAKRVADDILRVTGVEVTGPRVLTQTYVPDGWGNGRPHQDFCFVYEAELPADVDVPPSPWWAALDWHDPDALPADAYARDHGDVIAWWRTPRG